MKTTIFTFAAFFLVLTSCISERNVSRKYYTLEIPEEKFIVEADTIPPVPGKCEIGQVNINPVYDKSQIVNRNDSHEITYYMYHQWAVRPDEAIRELLRSYLKNKKLFEDISPRYSRSIPDYRMETLVDKLEIIENNKSFSAHVRIEFMLLLSKNDSILLTHQADVIEKLDTKDLNLFAGEVSNIIYRELEAFAGLIRGID
ncbi:MAG: ABC-type transport auxiliary lipoprotein family protein [Bacteroidales bacterium]|nr:ABC-type transport auxiliary lipoprotein family protein [Bacteroidales bacterium]